MLDYKSEVAKSGTMIYLPLNTSVSVIDPFQCTFILYERTLVDLSYLHMARTSSNIAHFSIIIGGYCWKQPSSSRYIKRQKRESVMDIDVEGSANSLVQTETAVPPF